MIADIERQRGRSRGQGARRNARFVAPTSASARGRAPGRRDRAAFGALDILVNNAGIIHAADFLDIAEADFDRVLRVNLKGAFLAGRRRRKQMVAQVKAGRPPARSST